jgi:mRNA interferase RelE/StbE
MYKIRLSRRAVKFIQGLPFKHQEQIKKSINSLEKNAAPHDSQALKGYPYRRLDCGEYRVIYMAHTGDFTVDIILVGKRNGGEVYQQLKHLR